MMKGADVREYLASIDWGHVFASIWDSVWAVIPDLVQIFILYLVIYSILKAAKGSRFGQVLLGAGVLVTALAFFTLIFHFDVLQKILSGLLIYLALSTVVIFQQEIRKFLEMLGTLIKEDKRRSLASKKDEISPEAFVDGVILLARRKMGALLAFERGISLLGYEMSGVPLDARISSELLISIFTPPLPLHDGGAIIRNGRLAAAHCLFPVSNNPIGLSTSGMRHRAAVGLTEETDALVVVVSEERGQISLAHNGQLIRYPDLSDDTRKAILRRIRTAMPQAEKTTVEAIADWIGERGVWLTRLHSSQRPKKGSTAQGGQK